MEELIAFNVLQASPRSMPEKHEHRWGIPYCQKVNVGPYVLNVPPTVPLPDEPVPPYPVSLEDYLARKGWEQDTIHHLKAAWGSDQEKLSRRVVEASVDELANAIA